jgi:hypothetical protein
MTKFLAPMLVALPLLGAVGTQAAIAATNDPLGFFESQAHVVNIAEGCGFGYYRNGNGDCRYYGPRDDGREACPPNTHFQQSSNYPQGRCLLNHY